MAVKRSPKEGELYKVFKLGKKSFEVYYGYYAESDRTLEAPMPIFPDFISNPEYDENGRPLATRIQDACEHYDSHQSQGDGWCADCKYFLNHDEISFCKHHKRLKIIENTNGAEIKEA